MEKHNEPWTFPVWPQDYHEIIPNGPMEIQIWLVEWLEAQEPFRNLALWLVPVERRYAHECFIVPVDITAKLGFFADKLFRITTGIKELPKGREIEATADAIVGKRLLAEVKSKRVDQKYFVWITDLAPLGSRSIHKVPPGKLRNRLPIPTASKDEPDHSWYLVKLPPPSNPEILSKESA